MSIYTQVQPSLNARMIKVLWRQQQELLKKAPDCVTPIINDEDPIDIQADITGPQGTPYEDGIFRVKLFIPAEFPQLAPKGYFLTKIFHPNVSEKGEICVNTLKRDWNPKQWSLYNLFEVIKCLLIVPFPQSSLNEEAGKMFMDNYDEYFKVAKMLTEIHAKKKETKKEESNNDDDKDNNKDKDEIDEKDNEDTEMVFDFSSHKEKNSDKPENKAEVNEFIVNEKIETKDSMNCSFIKDNFNGDNSYSLFGNNNKVNYNNQVFNFDNNDNYLDNFNITRSKTIRFGERPKFSILNCHTESTSSQLFHNSINVFSRMSSISSINSINSNVSNLNNYEIQKVSTFKDKPKLGSLPLMCSNSIKTKNDNKSYGFFRSKTMKIDNTNNSKKNNKDEINKWLMRI
jgi:ubiquitin-conjugating enzyme E2 S